MPKIILPDGSEKMFDGPVSGLEIAASIGPGLAKAALAMEVDGKQRDLSDTITTDSDIRFLTAKDPAGLEILRHSTAHLLAYAVKELFPEAQVTIGPVIENGFYYDFSYQRPFTPDDLISIEQRMQELAKRDIAVSREVWPRTQAVEFFRSIGEHYKAEIIASIPADEDVSLYREGDFIDLCRGPHVPSTGKLKSFKLMRLAGAYWRGDSNNEMLQRIYGTAWANKDQLQAYLHQLEEAEKRDHRRVGKQLGLFHMQEEAPGMAFWHPKGWTLWQQVEQYIRQVYQDSGFQEVRCPQILDVSLWKASGHWDNYKDGMFFTASENREYAVKPMNCPGHVQIFKHGLHSYRELPIRYGEFGSCHRNEPSGALHGLMRVRSFTQDDGHVFCTEDQITDEVVAFIKTLRQAYADFGFTDILYKLATRPEQRIGEDAAWEKAEKALAHALEQENIDYELNPGEGAFYGPKIEFSLRDTLGRVWQCGTMQVDFFMPGRLGAEYVTDDSSRRTPVMLHRAMVGSLERFIGILIEHYAGHFPLWLAPIQCVVTGITDQQTVAVEALVQRLQQAGIRAVSDLRNEKVSYKIREHSLQKIPAVLVLGNREIEHDTVTVRRFGSSVQTTVPAQQLIEDLLAEINSKQVPTTTEAAGTA